MHALRLTVGSFVLLMVSFSAPAEATRPLMRAPSAIKVLRLSQPISLKDAVSQDVVGLDLEDQGVRTKVLAQAKEYITYRSASRNRAETYLAKCGKTSDNPFCDVERQRQPGAPAVARFANEKRIERKEIADFLRDGNFDKITGRTESDVTAAISSIGDAQAVVPIAQRASEVKGCVPTAVATGLGYKLEELFPNANIVELSKTLYRKSVGCGNDALAGKAAFRLGLILVWQKEYAQVPELMIKTESIPESSQFHARARYWRYFCASAAGDELGRKAAEEALLRDSPLSFQTLAINGANEESMNRVIRTDDPQIAMRSLVRPELNATLRAAEALARAGSTHLAAEVLDHNVIEIGGLEPEVRLYAAVFLNRIGYALPKFKILSGLFQDSPRMVSVGSLKLLFPLWYFDLVKGKQDLVDPLLLLSLIRQESAFNAVAHSSVGARGLMQVMPATARMIASVRAKQLFEPATNVRVGTKYFLKQLHQYGGDVELTLAAYNAGFSRVDQWVKRYPTENRILFLDFIPFRETREYVTAILRNYYWYTKLYAPAQAIHASNEITPHLMPIDLKMLAIMSANAGAAAQPIVGPMPEARLGD